MLFNLLLMLNAAMAQKVEFETLEINYGNIAKGANGVRFLRKTQIGIASSIVLSKETKEPIDVVITLTGKDQKGNKYSISTDVAPLYKTERIERYLTIDASEQNNIFITEATITATDSKNKTKSATESFDVAKVETSFSILLNGMARPTTGGKGQCSFGRCFCIDGSSGSDCEGKLLDLGNILANQQLTFNKEKSNSTLDFTISLKNYNAEEINLIKRLMIWGVLNFEAEITDEFKNTVSLKQLTPIYKEGATEVELFKGTFNNQKNEKNRISGIRLMEVNPVNDVKTTLKTQYHSGHTGPTSNFHVWNEIWLIDQGVDFCNKFKFNEAFITQTTSEKTVAVVLGLNNTKEKEPNKVEALLTSRRVIAYSVITWQAGNNKPFETTALAVETSSGRWLFNDTVQIKDEKPAIQAIKIYFINVCKDTFLFEGTHLIPLKNKEYSYKMPVLNLLAGDKTVKLGSRINAMLIQPGSGISISGGSVVLSDNSKFTVGGTIISVNSGNFKNKNVTSIGVLRGRWDDKYSEGKSPGTWSSSREMFEYTFAFDASKEKPITLTDYTLYLVTEKKDTILFESTGEIGMSLDEKHIMVMLDKGEKIKYFNPCKTKYKLKEITYAETSNSGMYGLKVSFQFENNSDMPDSAAMIVEVKDCNGNSSYIQITLKYDAGTQTYTGSQVLTEIKGCKYEMVYGEIAAYNSCGDKTVWSFETSKSKSNGKGTRVVATTNNGNPGLL